MLLGLLDILLCLEFSDFRMISNLAHPLDNAIHERVKALHDVQLLLKILDNWNFGLQILDPLRDLLSLQGVFLRLEVHVLGEPDQIRSHLLH